MGEDAPDRPEILELARSLGFRLGDEELDSYHAMISGAYPIFRWMDAQEEVVPPTKYPRGRGYRPSREENPYNGLVLAHRNSRPARRAARRQARRDQGYHLRCGDPHDQRRPAA